MKMFARYRRFHWIVLLAVGFLAHSALAIIEPDGTLDLTFDAGKITNGEVNAAILQLDGKLLIGGHFTKVNGVTRQSIARLNPDGTLDPSFDPGGGPDGGIGLSTVSGGMLLQQDGKIVIYGGFTLVNGIPRAGIARLNNDGSLDAAFDPGHVISLDGSFNGTGGTNTPGFVNGVVLQGDGKIVVTGQFFFIITGPSSNVARSCVARFNSDGTFDITYDPGAGLSNTADPTLTTGNYAVRQSSGKVIIEGLFDSFNGNPVPGLVRLNTNGSYDNTFAPGTAASSSNISGLFVQTDDRIIVFGNFTSFNGLARNSIVRLDAVNGAVDPTFNTAAFQAYGDQGIIVGVAQQADQKLLVGGLFHSLGADTTHRVARLNTDGTRDSTFDASVAAGNGFGAECFAIRPADNKIFVGGSFSTYNGAGRNGIVLVNPNGSVDNIFVPSSGVLDGSPAVFALATQSDGKILVGGFFSLVNGEPHYSFVRLNPDGSIDHTFGVSSGTDRSVRAMLIQPDGKIMIAGQFRAIDGTPRGRVARLNPDGTIDPSFDPGNGPDEIVFAMAQDSAGNTYIGGSFLNVNGTPRAHLAKLKPDGSLDATFNPGTGLAIAPPESVDVRALAPPTATGGLVVAGHFSSYNGTSVGHIVRVDASTAAIDTAFRANNGTGFGPGFANVRALLVGSTNGKYRAGGNFTGFNGTTQPRFVRLNSDGSLDAGFTLNPPINGGGVFALARQNGKTLTGGAFTSPTKRITRYLDDGTVDPVFAPGTGVDLSPPNALLLGNSALSINAMSIQPDGKLLIGGLFNQYNGTTRFCLARLTGPPIITSPLVAAGTVGQPFTYQVEATGATSIGASNLPPGLTFSTSLGAITGMPTTAGTFQVGLSASNAAGMTTATLTITVQPAPPSGPVIISGTSATGRAGQPFSFQVIATGGTAAARVGASGLPAGLSIDAVTGLISGTPTAEGSSAVTLTVTDGAFTTSSILQLTFTADPALPVITSPSSAPLTPGVFFSYTITAPSSADPSDPTTFTLIGTLPPGLSFNAATGTISGTYIGPLGPDLAGGTLLGNIQLFATNSHGTSTFNLALRAAPSGAVNIATRLPVGTGANVLIGGFIVTGNAPKVVLIRAIGPSLTNFGVPNALQDPTLELHDGAHPERVVLNDNWKDTQEQIIRGTGIAPADDRESAIVIALDPGSYTAIVAGKNSTTGIGLVEVYDLGTAPLGDSGTAKLANIATRGFVDTGDNVMAGGFIVITRPTRVVIRAIGPSLGQFGVPDALANPQLELHDATNTIARNDDWQTTQLGGIITSDQVAEIQNSQLAPTNPAESAIIATLQPGSYTAIVRGVNNTTGNGLVEVYALQ